MYLSMQSLIPLQSGAAGDDPRYNLSTSTRPEKVSCQFAHQQCTFRSGCGSTLLSYNFECHDLVRAHMSKSIRWMEQRHQPST